tara:strand:+ start:62 stop:760 length:699 start_codon:yes stop_codon:yes gene_type:complete
MSTAFLVSLAGALLLGVAHFWNEHFVVPQKFRPIAISFVAGIAVAYSFLFLLPDVSARADHFGSSLYFILLAGFAIVHLLEKFAYRHYHGLKSQWYVMHAVVHVGILFTYYTIVGSILYVTALVDIFESILFVVPLAFYATVGVISLEEIHINDTYTIIFRWILSASAVLGVLLGRFTVIAETSGYHALFAFVVGGFFYIIMIDLIPTKDKGAPAYFLLGVLIYALATFFIL